MTLIRVPCPYCRGGTYQIGGITFRCWICNGKGTITTEGESP